MTDSSKLEDAAKGSDLESSQPGSQEENPGWALLVAAAAAFAVYFCMYAFRKPFSAATFDDLTWWGLGFKSVIVISQLTGYMLSKFVGIKVVSEMSSHYRAVGILGLIGLAELALIGFAYLPLPLKIVAMFLNGLPLGMVFGLVLAYLEGRKQTEALTAALCASFIVSSGVVKSIGRWLIESMQVSEFAMPMVVGMMFFPPLLIFTYLLQRTPPPSLDDTLKRSRRSTMSARLRRDFYRAYWPGLTLLVFVYVVLTIVRTARDDFGVEIWLDMGVREKPAVFAQSETLVAIFVTAVNALAIWIPGNLAAIRMTVISMCSAFLLVCVSCVGQQTGWISPMTFMVLCGIGLYIPYVAFHTTVFERLIAASKRPSNLGFLMYLADAIGYLGYALVLVLRQQAVETTEVLPAFRTLLIGSGIVCSLALVVALLYFQHRLASESRAREVQLANTGGESTH